MKLDYGLDQRVPFLKSLLFGVQWGILLISIIIILGKIISGVHFTGPMEQTVYLQKLLFLSSITLFTQILWGHKLPLIPGPSAILLIGVISSQDFEINTIYSSVMLGGLILTIVALTGLFKSFQKLFTTNLIAVVLLLIAFTLIPTIQELMIDKESGIDPLYNMSYSLILTFLMFIFYKLLHGIWKSTLIIWAMIFGSLLYIVFFPIERSINGISNNLLFGSFFHDMNFHLSIQPGVLISFIVCFIALSINDLASIQSVSEMLKPGNIEHRVTLGVSVTGIGNIIAGFLGIIGPVNYSFSPGVILSTGCASRFTLLPTVFILLILSFFPVAIRFIGSVPSVVIGAVLAYIMTSQVAAGLIVALGRKEEDFKLENGFVIGLPIILGIIITFLPDQIVNLFPPFLNPILSNGFVVGILSAFILEHIILRKK
jgi:xanthine/uracil permease